MIKDHYPLMEVKKTSPCIAREVFMQLYSDSSMENKR